MIKQHDESRTEAEKLYESIKADNNELGINLNMYLNRINKFTGSLGNTNLDEEDIELISKIEQTLKILNENI